MSQSRPLAGRTLSLNFGKSKSRKAAPVPQALMMSALIGSASDR